MHMHRHMHRYRHTHACMQVSTFRPRVPRAPPVLPGGSSLVAIDGEWKAAMEKSTRDAVGHFDLSPGSAVRTVTLGEAALELASSPARYGIHPADALQAVRLYYA